MCQNEILKNWVKKGMRKNIESDNRYLHLINAKNWLTVPKNIEKGPV